MRRAPSRMSQTPHPSSITPSPKGAAPLSLSPIPTPKSHSPSPIPIPIPILSTAGQARPQLRQRSHLATYRRPPTPSAPVPAHAPKQKSLSNPKRCRNLHARMQPLHVKHAKRLLLALQMRGRQLFVDKLPLQLGERLLTDQNLPRARHAAQTCAGVRRVSNHSV